MKNFKIYERAVQLGSYIVENNSTVREAAKAFKISKSTVYANLTKELPDEDILLYEKVKQQFEYNNSVKHIRGGETTRKKYSKLNK